MAISLPGTVEPAALLALLADGELHSGARLAEVLGVSRAAVWKGIERLRRRSIEIQALARQGYALPHPVELLADPAIRRALRGDRMAHMRRLELLFDVDSTNTRLLDAPAPPPGCADVILCELQHAGRGRRGRQWLAPFGGSLALSLAWSFADFGRVSPALSLCVGVAVARALKRSGAAGIALKWPNDIWIDDRKAGGVLLELRAEASGPAHVVIGVGLNIVLTPLARRQIEMQGVRVAAVADACPTPPSRNFVAGAIIDELLSMLMEFEGGGFEAFRPEWTALDALRDRQARVLESGGAARGTARGVDAVGALRLEVDGQIRTFVSGEVSLRLGENDS